MRKKLEALWQKRRKFLWNLGLLCFLSAVMFSLPALGKEDPKELGTLANTEIRQAEKLMFAGKAEEARDMLLQGLATLEKLKEVAPGDGKIKGLENKARQIQKQLEKKLGAPLQTPPAADVSPSSPPSSPPAAETAQEASSGVSSEAELSPDALEKKISQELRKAERSFMEGKREEALSQLLETWDAVVLLRQKAPESSQLDSLEGKAKKLASDLGKRTSRKIDLEAGTVTPLEGTPEAAPATPSSEGASASQKLSYHLREKLKEAVKLERGAASALKWVDTYKEEGQSSALWLPKIEAAEKQLESLEQLLGECAADAAGEGAPDHPDILALQESQEKLLLRCGELRQEQQEALAREEGAAREAMERGHKVIAFYEALEERHKDLLRGNPLDYGNLENPPYQEALQRLEDFRSQEIPAIRDALGILNPLYGTTPSEIEENMRRAGYSGSQAPWYSYSLLEQAPEKAEETRIATAKDLAAKVEHRMEYLSGMHDFARLDTHEIIREYARLAGAFAPEDPEIESLAEGLEERLRKDKQAWLETIRAREWPGSLPGRDAEEKAGMAFFENDPGWGKREDGNRVPRKVAIRGEWSVQAKDVLGNPTMYGIPALVAVEVPQEREEGLLRVYNVTLRTEERGGVRPEPPFAEITVGDSWYIPSEALR